MVQSNWRLLSYQTGNAAYNMAVDEAILEAHLQGLVPPTLRIYGFVPGAISIGHSQSLSEDAKQRAYAYGLEIVRRPTGGRAVLHVNELTYSFVGSTVGSTVGSASAAAKGSGENDNVAVLSTSIIEAYKQICLGLCYGLKGLGVELELGETNVAYKHVQDCFLATTGSDLHFQGKKMIGSAQLRRKTAVLQHGSILLNQAQFLMQEILDGKDSFGKNSGQDAWRHANLFEVLSRSVSLADLETALAEGFAHTFAHPFVASGLTVFEQDLVAKLEPKYKNCQAS
jgi:lipoate-protein ligase A